MPFKSAKTTVRDAKLRELTVAMLAVDDRCGVRSAVCTQQAVCLHHVTARSVAPERVLDPTNVLRSCRACNDYIETAAGSRWAEAVGVKRRSWQ